MKTQKTAPRPRRIVWPAVAAVILLVPLVAMQFTDQVHWDLTDFMVTGALLFGTGLTYELVARKAGNASHRVIMATVLVLAVLLIWIDLAVGIFNVPGISGS